MYCHKLNSDDHNCTRRCRRCNKQIDAILFHEHLVDVHNDFKRKRPNWYNYDFVQNRKKFVAAREKMEKESVQNIKPAVKQSSKLNLCLS